MSAAYTADELAAIVAKMEDPLYRLCCGKLYGILTSDGRGVIPFTPRPEQVLIFERIYGRKWDPVTQTSTPHGIPADRVMIPKARRLGISTAIGVMMADASLWSCDTRATVIDQNAGDAERKLAEIMKVAVEFFRNADPDFRAMLKVVKDNDSTFSFSMAGNGKSEIHAVAGARGGTNDWLWVSEWGVIQHEDPKRSARIRSGALPSARHGKTIVETTWAGGKTGDLWELMEPVLSGESDDWTILFFPWYVDPRNVHDTATIDEPARKYFEKIRPRLAAAGVVLSERQVRWYAMERRAQGIFMTRENPTFLDECWSAPVKGAIYAAEIDQARAEGRVGHWPVDPSCLVHSAWDLGSPQNTVVWYFQLVGPMLRVVDVDFRLELTATQRVAHMLGKPYGNQLGKHLMPHDATSKNSTGESPVQVFSRAGLKQINVIPRCHDEWTGINALREIFPLMQFDTAHCDEALSIVGTYHTRPATNGGAIIDEPVHDSSSHFADAMRYIAEGIRGGFLRFSYGPGIDPSNVKPFERRRSMYEPVRRKTQMRIGG